MSMTTELAQRMKVAAENLDGDTWHYEGASVYGGAYDVGDTVCYDHIVDCENVNGESLVAEFIAIANPANVKTLVEALEAALKRNVELERYRTAYLEWSNKTDWVQGDKRFDVVKPLGKHRADVLREFIKFLEARTVKLPKPISVLHRRDFNDAHRTIYAYPEAEVNAALAAAGVAVEGE